MLMFSFELVWNHPTNPWDAQNESSSSLVRSGTSGRSHLLASKTHGILEPSDKKTCDELLTRMVEDLTMYLRAVVGGRVLAVAHQQLLTQKMVVPIFVNHARRESPLDKTRAHNHHPRTRTKNTKAYEQKVKPWVGWLLRKE